MNYFGFISVNRTVDLHPIFLKENAETGRNLVKRGVSEVCRFVNGIKKCEAHLAPRPQSSYTTIYNSAPVGPPRPYRPGPVSSYPNQPLNYYPSGTIHHPPASYPINYG